MKDIKVFLFDADGVLTLPEEFFTEFYARSRGLDPEPFNEFFKTEFPAARIGAADLKELIDANPALWQWDKSIYELLELWFETENVRNEELISFVQELRAAGTPCYVATNQEKYRAAYMQQTMFKNEFDGFFVSALLGHEKPNADFYDAILVELKSAYPELVAENIAFIDDSPKNVEAARQSGMRGIVYQDVEQIMSLFNVAR